jgi:hypothetical protein
MKTDDLIAMLSTNVEPVDHRRETLKLAAALTIGAVFAVGAMMLALGIRSDLTNADALKSLYLKLLFAGIVVVIAAISLSKLMRPGGERGTSIALAVLPFAAVMLLAAINLAFAPASYWNKMILGDRWLECLLSIPVIAIVPFAVIVWLVRRMAPTNLVRAGAFAGLVAGALSAAGYALHCTDDSLPFVALWYGGTIALCTAAGAALGPRLLRW